MIKKAKTLYNMFVLKRIVRKKMMEIENTLPEKFRHQFKANCFLAGGAIRSILVGKRVKDWDIFFNSDSDRITGFLQELGNTYGHPNLIIQYKSDNALSVLINGTMVQFIGKKYSGTPDHVIGRFDFTNSMGYYDYANDNLTISPEMQKSCENKELVFNDEAFSPKLSPKRAKKFIDDDWDYSPEFDWGVFETATGVNEYGVNNLVSIPFVKKGSKEDSESYGD